MPLASPERAQTTQNRRAFLRLIAAVPAVAVALRSVKWLEGATPAGGIDALDSPFVPPPFPRIGVWSEEAMRERGIAIATHNVEYWRELLRDQRNCWDEICPALYAVPAERRQLRFQQLFAPFVHGQEIADFVFWLSEVDFSRPAKSQIPSTEEANRLVAWAFGRASADSVAVLNLGDPLADVEQFGVLLSWEDGVRLRKEGAEFDGDMVVCEAAFVASAFGRAAEQLLPAVRHERMREPLPHAGVGVSALEMVMGGHQSIAYQEALGRSSEAVTMARLAASGYLFVGRRPNRNEATFVRIESLGAEVLA